MFTVIGISSVWSMATISLMTVGVIQVLRPATPRISEAIFRRRRDLGRAVYGRYDNNTPTLA